MPEEVLRERKAEGQRAASEHGRQAKASHGESEPPALHPPVEESHEQAHSVSGGFRLGVCLLLLGFLDWAFSGTFVRHCTGTIERVAKPATKSCGISNGWDASWAPCSGQTPQSLDLYCMEQGKIVEPTWR